MTELKRLRCMARMTQVTAAGLIGVHQSQVSRWEAGSSIPDIASIVAISKAYGCSTDEVESAITEILENKKRRLEAELERRMRDKLKAEGRSA